jgi:RNA-directed DNA polymerase
MLFQALNQIIKLSIFVRSRINNERKSRIAKTNDTDFLGFTFKGAKIRWSDKAFREFKRRVKRLSGRSWFVSMEYRMKKLAQYLRGWMNYFGISEYYRPIPEIDHWLRRRVRMCYWK